MPSANLIDGKAVAAKIREGVSNDVKAWIERGHRAPKLQVILVGENPPSSFEL